ncbi:MAG: TRAP transporter permease [Firmicutes bacterium]|jgi:TRAP transporter 4TM/12TM fusion protein|nr:TRAP transporter permease [Bacillota bacterium]
MREQVTTQPSNAAMPEEEQDSGGKRHLTGVLKSVAGVIAIVLSLFHLYTGYFGILAPPIPHEFSFRAAHLMFAMTLVFLLYLPNKSAGSSPFWRKFTLAMDIVLSILGVIGVGYLVVNFPDAYLRAGMSYQWEYWLAAITLVLVLEAARRAMGPSIPIIAVVFILYARYGQWAPEAIAHAGFSWRRILTSVYLMWDGILGTALQSSAQYVFLFILFGAFLKISGGGEFFINLALAMFGRVRGGPAKAAVVSSALMGTISGSSVANVVTTGSFTIPLMKRIGYDSFFAGAVEAVASSGGQIMPPIMGAAAFVMSEMINVPYATICLAALMPAILYYVALFLMVDLEAKRKGLKGIPRKDLPSTRRVLAEGWQFLIPLALIVTLLVLKYSPMKAGFAAILCTLAVTFFRKETRMDLPKVLQALKDGAFTAAGIACACGALGIIISMVLMSGLATKLSTLLIELSGGHLIILLILTMLSSIIMGMGLPTIACYVILSVLVAPALVKMGLPALVAHLFIFYFGSLSHITPPVAIAAYAAAGIAQANPMRTGFTAWRLGLTGFIVPYIFVYGREILLGVTGASATATVFVIISAIIGVTALAMSLSGVPILSKGTSLAIPQRAMLFLASMLLIQPGYVTDTVGLVLMALAMLTSGGLTRSGAQVSDSRNAG